MKNWSLIVDRKPLEGSWNMAVDDFLFHSLGEEPQTFLRFYTWKRPTASLGYSQNVHRVLDVGYCKRNGIDVVRRITGGKMVLHYREVTYSINSSDSVLFTDKLTDSYKLISEAMMKGLENMGLDPILAAEPPASYTRGNLPCFSYPARNEVEVKGKKIIGSAQKRVGSNFIQHGSIPLQDDGELLKKISFLGENEGDVRMIALSHALGKDVSFEWAVEHLIAGISDYFNVELLPKILSEDEKQAVTRIQKERYSNSSWTYDRLADRISKEH